MNTEEKKIFTIIKNLPKKCIVIKIVVATTLVLSTAFFYSLGYLFLYGFYFEKVIALGLHYGKPY